MIEKTIVINAETEKAEKNVNDLIDALNGTTEAIKGIGKTAEKEIKETEKAVEKTTKETGNLKKGFENAGKGVKTLGLGLKALGIGLIVAAFAALSDLFRQNQKIADVFGASVKSLAIIFNDLFSFVNKNFSAITNVFKNPIQSVKQLGGFIKRNIEERFIRAIDVAGLLGKALVKLFKGDFKGAANDATQAGKEFIDTITNVDDSIGKIVDLTNKTIDYAKATFQAAKALQAQENAAKLAVAQQSRLVEQYDREAELQRQIRDDVSKSIQERIAANEKLGESLDKQEKAMLRQADAQIQAAANQLALNKSIENQVALIEAQANREGVLAQITGFRSEQDINRVALQKEEIENLNEIAKINKDEFELRKIEADQKLEADQLLIENTIANEILKNEALLEAEKEYQGELKSIESDRLARVQEKIDKEIALNKQKTDKEAEQEESLKNAKVGFADQTFALVSQIAGQGSKLGKAIAVADVVRKGIEGVQSAYTTAQKSPITTLFPAYPIVQAGLAGAFSGVQLAKIKSAPEIGGGGAASGGGSVPQAPSFNLVEGSGTNQIAESLNREQSPIKAYVISSEVTTSQALDRNIETTATI